MTIASGADSSRPRNLASAASASCSSTAHSASPRLATESDDAHTGAGELSVVVRSIAVVCPPCSLPWPSRHERQLAATLPILATGVDDKGDRRKRQVNSPIAPGRCREEKARAMPGQWAQQLTCCLPGAAF